MQSSSVMPSFEYRQQTCASVHPPLVFASVCVAQSVPPNATAHAHAAAVSIVPPLTGSTSSAEMSRTNAGHWESYAIAGGRQVAGTIRARRDARRVPKCWGRCCAISAATYARPHRLLVHAETSLLADLERHRLI